MIASAGGHNMLMIGEPGCGKSMIAKRIPSILPQMSDCEALETTRIHSIAGEYRGGGLMRERPFRAPHHNISMNALTGGDSCFREGPNSTKEIRKMVLKAREIQAERYKDYPDINLNCQMHDGMLKKFCVMTPDAESELQDIVKSRKYSARVINRMLRVMRTIADVEGSDIIDMTHVRFAAMLRSELA